MGVKRHQHRLNHRLDRQKPPKGSLQFETRGRQPYNVLVISRSFSHRFYTYLVMCIRYILYLPSSSKMSTVNSLKFGYSEKATKFEKIFHLKFDVTYVEDFFQILWPSQNIRTLLVLHITN